MRMPAIGDHVWRTELVGVRPTFDGYVFAVGEAFTTIVPQTVAEYVIRSGYPATVENPTGQEVHGVKVLDGIRVATLFLVRQLHGWRWTPREMRPEVKPGDVIVTPTQDTHPGIVPPLPPERLLVVAPNVQGWDATIVGRAGPVLIAHHNIAKALAGLDGWSWEPARWPGEPGGGT